VSFGMFPMFFFVLGVGLFSFSVKLVCSVQLFYTCI